VGEVGQSEARIRRSNWRGKYVNIEQMLKKTSLLYCVLTIGQKPKLDHYRKQMRKYFALELLFLSQGILLG